MRYIPHPTREGIFCKTFRWSILATNDMDSPYDNEDQVVEEVDEDEIVELEIDDE